MMREALRGASQPTRMEAAMYVLKLSGLKGYAKLVEETREDKTRDALHQTLHELAEEMGLGMIKKKVLISLYLNHMTDI